MPESLPGIPYNSNLTTSDTIKIHKFILNSLYDDDNNNNQDRNIYISETPAYGSVSQTNSSGVPAGLLSLWAGRSSFPAASKGPAPGILLSVGTG